MNKTAELGKCSLFRNMPEASLDKLAEMAELQQLSVGTEILHEDKPVTALYVVVMGTVQVLKREQRGSVEKIAQLGTGSYLGELELASGELTSATSVETTEPTSVLIIPYERIRAVCAEDHEFAATFYLAIARGLARRLTNTTLDAAHYRALAVHHH